MKPPTSGFTLIELLIVIAIVAIVAAVVLVNLGTFRSKGSDTAILTDMKEFQGSALLIYQENKMFQKIFNGSWVDVCNWPTYLDPKPSEIVTQISSLSGGGVICNVSGSGAQFFVYAPLKNGNYSCVDGEGDIREITSTQASMMFGQFETDGPGFTCNPSD